MKTSAELRIEKTEKVNAMRALLYTDEEMKERKEKLTKDEQTQYDTMKKEVDTLERQISETEYFERHLGAGNEPAHGNNPAQHQRQQAPQIIKPAKPYSIGKAIKEFARGGSEKLSGIEREQHDELSRGITSEGLLVPFNDNHYRAATTSTHATSIDVKIDPDLSILGKEPLWAQMGMTILPGLTGTLKIGKKTPDEAGKYSETSTITATSNVPSYSTMSPERYGITDIFTKELLAQENPAIQAAIVADMIKGCDRKLTAEAYTIALAASTEVSAGALTEAGLNALMNAVEGNGAFLMDRGSFFEGKAVKFDTGSGVRLMTKVNGNVSGVGETWEGVPVFYSTLFADGSAKQYAIYGIMSELWLGFWGALEVLYNPYTYQKTGQIELTVNRLADFVVRNSGAFMRTPDLDATT